MLSICPFTSACFSCNNLSNAEILPSFLSSSMDHSSVHLLTKALLSGWRIEVPYPWCTSSININVLKQLSLSSTPGQRWSWEARTQVNNSFSCTPHWQICVPSLPNASPQSMQVLDSGLLPFDFGTEAGCASREPQFNSSAIRGASWSGSLTPKLL